MTINIEDLPLTAIQAEIRRIAAAQPDYYYEEPEGYGECVYVEDRDGVLLGSCIVGCALVNLGVDPQVLDRPPLGAKELFSEYGHAWGNPDLRWIQEVQNRQDGSVRWGDAVRLTDDLMGIKP